MAIKYCEFEPSQHRNKRVAQHVFLDEPGDPHPLAICDVCTKKLLQMRPEAVVMLRKEYEARRKKGTLLDAGTPEAEAETPAQPEAAEGEGAQAEEPEQRASD